MEDLREFQAQRIAALEAENAKLKEQLNQFLPKEIQYTVDINDPNFHRPIAQLNQ